MPPPTPPDTTGPVPPMTKPLSSRISSLKFMQRAMGQAAPAPPSFVSESASLKKRKMGETTTTMDNLSAAAAGGSGDGEAAPIAGIAVKRNVRRRMFLKRVSLPVAQTQVGHHVFSKAPSPSPNESKKEETNKSSKQNPHHPTTKKKNQKKVKP
ncbi:hypothetical protein NFJ02_17g27800 [Pycnococcus provasolii]